MKKKLFAILIVVMMATVAIVTNLYFNQSNNEVAMSEMLRENVEAIANINPECPDGCVEGTEKCYCHGWYENTKAGLPPV